MTRKAVINFEPVVQWVGGKGQLLDRLLPLVPARFGAYHEPFFGGGALFFTLAENGQLFNGATLNDKNSDLINVYQVVRERPEALIAELVLLSHGFTDDELVNEQYYKAARRLHNSKTLVDPLQRAAVFMFLNRMCFNGLWRVNRKGEFNVGYRKDCNRDIVRADQLRKASKLLTNTAFMSVDFINTLAPIRSGDFVYFDPPYQPVSETANFTAYIGDFDESHQLQLAQECFQLHQRDVYVMVSNAYHPYVLSLYPGWRHTIVDAKRSINSDGAKRGNVKELIITNY